MYSDKGSPQGSIASPVIANIFLDYVLDQWFIQVVTKHCRGYCSILRYADDVVAVFERKADAQRFMAVLPKRLGKYGLRINENKTHLMACGKVNARSCFKRGERPSTFDYLGITHYWGHSRRGYVRIKRKTSKKRMRRAIVNLNEWLRQHRSVLPLPELWRQVGQKLRGHFNYYGVSDNSAALEQFYYKTRQLVFKWLNRRSQRRSFSWESFHRYETRHPLPRPGHLVSLYAYEPRAL